MNSKELADRLDAEDRLRSRGYKKERCMVCNGSGSLRKTEGVMFIGLRDCPHCKGEGWEWKSPLTC